MKKLFIGIIATLLSLLFTLSASGCGCVSSSPLAFNNGFYGTSDSKPGVGYTETLVYKVKNQDSYDQYLTKNPAIDEVMDFSYNGTYTVVLKTKSHLDDTLPYEVMNSDIVRNVADNTGNCLIYEIVATLEYTSVYTIDNTTSTYQDRVVKTVYTCSSEHSFAPLFATTESKFSIVKLATNGAAQIEVQTYSDSVTYSNSSYQIKKTANTVEMSKDVTYSYRYLIDNNQLFFAIRNLSVPKSSSVALPTTSTTYEQTKNLVVKNEDEYQRDFDLYVRINGIDVIGDGVDGNLVIGEEQGPDYVSAKISVPVRKMSYILDNGSLSGSKQFLVVQNGKVMDGDSTLLDNFALPLEYASMICSYGTFVRMGALVYTLEQVSISK